MQRIRSDVKLTSYLEPLWVNRDADLQSLIRWTWAATSTGVLRVYPGVEVDTELDVTRSTIYFLCRCNLTTFSKCI